MQLPKELTTVTPVSKAVALLMFISLPIIAFFFGMRYQTILLDTTQEVIIPTPVSVACTMEAKICPDGTAVGRSGPNCEFAECPIVPTEEPFDKLNSKYTCPQSEYINCMPGPGTKNIQCTPSFLSWAQANCPGFKGAAY